MYMYVYIGVHIPTYLHACIHIYNVPMCIKFYMYKYDLSFYCHLILNIFKSMTSFFFLI